MQCPSCHADVSDDSKFCNQCGGALPRRCAVCGHENAPGSKFCSECGISLTGASPPPLASAEPEKPVASAERRHLTVMFCDLVGSTALSGRLDVEDLRDVIGTYQKCVAETVARFGGFVARQMGDGALIYFGFPRAHEDDPEEAVRAGVALVDAVGRLQGPEPLQVRVGIATGLAVVGDLIGTGAAHEQEIVGEMPNLAARLQALAEPNTIVIADSTRRLVGSVFEFEDLGVQHLKGIAEPQRVWRVIGESQVRSRFEALRSAETPLVGREEEIELLLRRWERAKGGEGRVVLLNAEPGIGKSRLIVALEDRLRAEPHISLRYFCSPHHQDSPLYPVIGQLERAAGFQRKDSVETKLDKLEVLMSVASPPHEDIALLAELLLLPSSRYPAVDIAPQRKKEKTFGALLRQLMALARQQPVLMVFEDLHWIDPTSRELLDLTVEQAETQRVLFIATFRPEFQPPWTDQPHVTTLTLNRLSRREAEAMVRRLTADTPLGSDLVEEIVERADGVALFLEEVTKAVVEAGARGEGMLSGMPSVALSVPPTLHASLMARLDRLGPLAKEIAQIGASTGREFSYELLTIVAQRPEAQLQEALRRLIEAGLVFQRGAPPRADFLFKHALVQDAAYSTLLRGPRRKLHARIAQALEERFPDIAQSRPELVARHLTEAGLPERAIPYWQRAGELALRHSAIGEAVAHFSSALRALEALPEGDDLVRTELEIRLGLGTALNIAHGSSHPEVAENYARAVSLGRQLGSNKELFRALWGSWYTTQTTGQCEQALHLADELVALAERLDDPDLMLEACHSRWASSHTLGRNADTLADTERGLALYDPDRHHAHAYHYGGHDTGVCAYTHNALTLWITGFPEQAAQRSEAAIRLGQRLGHPPSLAHAAWWSATIRQLLRDPKPCRELAELAIRIAEEQGSKILLMSPLLIGWTECEGGNTSEGLRLMEQNIVRARQSARRFYYDYELLVYAEELLKAGAPDRSLAIVEEALAFIETTCNQLFLAEAHRLKGACLAAFGGARTEEGLSWLEKAVAIAEEQRALAFKLRAAASLVRAQRDHGGPGRGRDLLGAAYREFTEGFERPDLKDAKSLLDELNGDPVP